MNGYIAFGEKELQGKHKNYRFFILSRFDFWYSK